jgi:exodeoxyribonuclease VII small subunit
MNKKKGELTYEDASSEIKEILSRLERGDIQMEDLIKDVERASFLLNYCKGRLHGISDNLEKVLDQDQKNPE